MAEQLIWRIALEITMALISNTLSCIFVVLQLFHVKRNPEALSSISLVMLLILSMGYMIPVVLNLEALFLGSRNNQTLLLSTHRWVEANEVSVRVITMVAFLLQIRLVQLVWTAKCSNNNEKGSWAAEIKAAIISLPMYVCGGLLTLLVNWTRNRYGYQAVNSSYSVLKQHSLWGDLRSYAGLILDGFLLPQVLLNVFMGSAEKALSHPFYVGISAVRLVPHAYDQYRRTITWHHTSTGYTTMQIQPRIFTPRPGTSSSSVALLCWRRSFSCSSSSAAVGGSGSWSCMRRCLLLTLSEDYIA
ncbi:UNVERIFIED_CONTAM: hypothetical protein Sangu_2855100 [Sesamum angustifolium]|uniref:RING-type E3 ubiquitin transferase n=1 Tax=Sesamum angustifolium TaxID=2727405 RepID=A0AAW2INJ2_9LAMI